MSVHQTPSGRWGVRWRDGDRNRQKIFTNKADAVRFDQDRQRSRQLGAFGEVEPSAMRLADLLRLWWAAESGGWARSNRIPRANLLDVWVAPYIGGVRLRDLGVQRITGYQSEIIAAGCSVKQANRALVALSAALSWAVRQNHLPSNPCARIRPRRVHEASPRPRAIGVEQVEQLRAVMPTARDRAMVSLLFYAGLRPGELLALRWSDIGERTITVDRNYTAGELKGTKTGKRRSVVLIPAVGLELAELRPVDAHELDLIAPNASGGFINLNNWRNRTWNPAVRAVGLDADPKRGVARLSPYDGRHSFASALIHEGRSIVEVAGQLGHSTASTTLKHYAHIVEESRGGERISLVDAVACVRDLFAMPDRRVPKTAV